MFQNMQMARLLTCANTSSNFRVFFKKKKIKILHKMLKVCWQTVNLIVKFDSCKKIINNIYTQKKYLEFNISTTKKKIVNLYYYLQLCFVEVLRCVGSYLYIMIMTKWQSGLCEHWPNLLGLHLCSPCPVLNGLGSPQDFIYLFFFFTKSILNSMPWHN